MIGSDWGAGINSPLLKQNKLRKTLMPCNYTQEQIFALREEDKRYCSALEDLEIELRKVLNSPKYNCLSNEWKSGVLLTLEIEGDYDPLG